jgi:hypothetical protein
MIHQAQYIITHSWPLGFIIIAFIASGVRGKRDHNHCTHEDEDNE